MKNTSCKIKRILALILALAIMCSVSAFAESVSAAVMGKSGFKVYTDPQLKNPFGTLKTRSVFTVENIDMNNVAQIRYMGIKLYAKLDSSVAAVANFAVEAIVNTNTYVYETPDTDSRCQKLGVGTEVYVLDASGKWAAIEKDGNVGFTYIAHLTPKAAGGSNNSIVNPEISVPENNSSAITLKTVAAEVIAASLPVHKSASASSDKLASLMIGTKLTIYAYNSEWAYIGMNGKYGFCPMQGLRMLDQNQMENGNSNPFENNSAFTPVIVIASSLKVYQGPSASSKKLATLKAGAEVNLVGSNGTWAYIELNGNYGYCNASALIESSKLNSTIQPPMNNNAGSGEVIQGRKPLGTCSVVKPNAKVYASKSTSSASTVLPMGKTLSFYAYDSNWVMVGIDGGFGFMQQPDLNPDSYVELKNEDSGTAVSNLENALLALGYLDSIPSANFSANTVNALNRLQAACGMEQTGIADIGTLRIIYSGNAPVSPMLSVSLSNGSQGENVRRLQSRLLALGYLSMNSSVDGDYGRKTASAVGLFQSVVSLTTTGTADSNTLRALYSANAPKLPSDAKPADANTSSSSNSSGISSNLASTVTHYSSNMSNAQKLEYVIYVAQQQLGKKYVFGATGTSTFDCSGLTQYCFKQIGVSLLRTAYSEGYNDDRPKISSKSSLRRGDLVFFNTVSDGDLSDHTGIYLGNNYFIHASSGAGEVTISDMSSGYYDRVFSWGRRVLPT